MGNELIKIREAVVSQLDKTDKVIASNDAIASTISDLDYAFSSGFHNLAEGLKELCFLSDEGFREVSYKLDLQLETSQAIKEILARPLDTQAKELRQRAEFAYQNGWIDEAEVDLLESEKKNYQDFIALHILGNIYYHHKKKHQKALEYFQKAAKYAAPQSKVDACRALLCTARVYKELGTSTDAYKTTKLSLGILPDDTQNLFEHAAYSAMERHVEEAIDYLRKAVLKDPSCIIAADRDKRFTNVREEKEKLKRDLRDEQRQVVEQLRQRIASLRQEINFAQKEAALYGITDFISLRSDLANLADGVAKIDKLHANNSYFDLLEAEHISRDVIREGWKAYWRNLDMWIKIKNASLDKLKPKKHEIENKKYCGWGFFITVIVGILAYTIIDNTPLGNLGEPKKIGPPKKVLTFTSDAKYKSASIKKGYSFEVVSETGNEICARYPTYGVVCADRANIFKFAKLEMGYFNDYRWLLPGVVAQLLVFVFPFIVGILSSILMKKKDLNVIKRMIAEEDNAITKLSNLKIGVKSHLSKIDFR